MTTQEPRFDPDGLYDQFPAGAEDFDDPDGPFGPEQGFNSWVQLNDVAIFRQEALDASPALRAFVDDTFVVTFARFKSSHRETEYFIHKPLDAMAGKVAGIEGTVAGISGDDPQTHIATLAFNHERTLARHLLSSIVVTDGGAAGQILHKKELP